MIELESNIGVTGVYHIEHYRNGELLDSYDQKNMIIPKQLASILIADGRHINFYLSEDARVPSPSDTPPTKHVFNYYADRIDTSIANNVDDNLTTHTYTYKTAVFNSMTYNGTINSMYSVFSWIKLQRPINYVAGDEIKMVYKLIFSAKLLEKKDYNLKIYKYVNGALKHTETKQLKGLVVNFPLVHAHEYNTTFGFYTWNPGFDKLDPLTCTAQDVLDKITLSNFTSAPHNVKPTVLDNIVESNRITGVAETNNVHNFRTDQVQYFHPYMAGGSCYTVLGLYENINDEWKPWVPPKLNIIKFKVTGKLSAEY